MEYNFSELEKKWQNYWATNKTFAAKDGGNKPKYYVLDMFPYPSGAGLHVGHPLGYIASDIMARYKRHKGFNVLHPMGYDSFGLPAEQYAIQTGQHPKITTEQNITRYRQQMDKIGFSFDWDREVRTSDPEYYKWTQWIFIQIFNSWYNKTADKAEHVSTLIKAFESNGNANVDAVCDEDVKPFSANDWKAYSEKEQSDILMKYRLAYLGEAYVNWCPALGTVLANDEVKDGVSERGGHPVERKLMKQWSMRITAYAQRLLDGLETIDWTESLKESQRYWIGRSEGTSLKFKISPFDSAQGDKFIEVFTTRPDTVFGVSFVTLAPEHELVNIITAEEQREAVNRYVEIAKNRSERERQAEVDKVSGVFTGSYVLHPFTGKQIPIWVGDYVLAGYGTGAVMAVPAHDERDYKFAKHFNLPLPQVIEPPANVTLSGVEAWTEKEGTLINSDFLNGLDVKAAIKKAIEEIEKQNLGKGKTNYRLRDAVFGRQRYWGEPIPIYYKDGVPYALNESELPLVLPEVDKYLPTEDGEPPLARAASSWKHEGKYDYEHSTMPGWAGSSWYFLRYMDAHNEKEFVNKKLADYWQQVDLYIGGSEHATGHLLYVRFWTKFLKDLGYINIDEPAKKLINQGMIQGLSAYINRLSGINFDNTPKDFLNKIHELNHPVFFVSKNKLEQIKNSDNLSFIKEAYLKYNPGVDFGAIQFCYQATENKGFAKIPIDISKVNSDDSIDIKNFDNILKISNAPNLYNEFILEENNKFFLTREVEKMSKSKYNVVTPDDIVEKFGADTLRLYEMFLGPLEQSKPWNTNGITGVSGFLKKLWRLFYNNNTAVNLSGVEGCMVTETEPTKAELKTLHKTIKKITEDIERFSFNTSVSNFMICVNELTDLKCNKRAILEPLLILISPYAPHITEELWQQLGHTESIAFEPFPMCNESYLVDDAFNYPISFNGKMRFQIELPTTLTVPEIEKEVMSREEVIKQLAGATPKKIIIVPKKIVNIVH
ncbi:MAG: leucine--tRNA ligase [Bacteroidetes bacterium]|nr:leucine--tRNA ligase [Bacteroidota bacterium]MCA6441872.1 leucine--tRNA ligase [Bacteroidota bacterium]